jgi:hypothetical protein
MSIVGIAGAARSSHRDATAKGQPAPPEPRLRQIRQRHRQAVATVRRGRDGGLAGAPSSR